MTPIKFLFALALSLSAHAQNLPKLDVDNIRLDANTISTTNPNGHLIFSPNGTGKLELPTLGASTVPYLDSNKRLTSSSITPTELGYLSGTSSNLQTQLNGKIDAASPTFTGTVVADKLEVEGLVINDNLTVDDAVDSSSTGSGQSVQLNQPVTVFTNASLTSINNITVPLAYVGSKSHIFWIKNGKSSGNITLVENSGGTAASRIRTGTGFDLDIQPNQAVQIFYDTNVNRWQVSGGTGSGSSSAGTNDAREYISNGTAENNNTAGWATYSDAAGTAPVDGTSGGTANITIAVTSTAAQVRRGTYSFSCTKDAANRQGQGCSYDFTIDPQDAEAGRPVFVTFDYAMPSNYADNDMAVFVYDKTNGADRACRGFTGETSAPLAPIKKVASGSNGKFACVFYPSTATSYRLIIHQSSTTALGYSLYFDSVHAGPDVLAPGVFGTGWETCTGSGSWVSNTTYTCLIRRDKDSAEIYYTVTTSGAPTSTNLTLNLPNSLTIDTTKINSTQFRSSVGRMSFWDASASQQYDLQVVYGSANTNVSLLTVGTGGAGAQVTHLAPVTVAASDTIMGSFKVPIANWAASNMLSTTEVNLQNPANAPLTATSGIKTPGASAQYHAHTGNSLTLTRGTWILTGSALFNNSGSNPSYTQVYVDWFAANGGDSGTNPAALSTVVTVLNSSLSANQLVATNLYATQAASQTVRCDSPTCTVYLNTYSVQTTSANARVSVALSAAKQPDFSVFGVYSKERVERASVTSACSSSPCTIASQSNSWLTSITRSATGNYTANIATNTFSSAPTCTVSAGSGSFAPTIRITSTSTSSIQFQMTNGAFSADIDTPFYMLCMGPQ